MAAFAKPIGLLLYPADNIARETEVLCILRVAAFHHQLLPGTITVELANLVELANGFIGAFMNWQRHGYQLLRTLLSKKIGSQSPKMTSKLRCVQADMFYFVFSVINKK